MNNAFRTISKGSLKEMGIIVPIFYVAILLGVFMNTHISRSVMEGLATQHLIYAIPIAALLGILLPIPRYATYPIAFVLLTNGVGYGIIFALICGEVIGESIVRDVMEVKYLGLRFFLTRFVLSFVFISIGGFIIELFL
jgi:uncharacterized membrane protein YraQ (UPF0718 family)